MTKSFLFIDLDIAAMAEINVVVSTMILVRVLVLDYVFTFCLQLSAHVTLYYPPAKIIQSVATSGKPLSVYVKSSLSLSI